jgi:hypothetical protein
MLVGGDEGAHSVEILNRGLSFPSNVVCLGTEREA